MKYPVFWLAISSCLLFIGVAGEHKHSEIQTQSSDFLLDHIPDYVALIVGLFMLQSVVLISMGQPCLPSSGRAFWYDDTAGSGNSQHILDWYTFTHILHGFLFDFISYGLGQWLPVVTVNYGYVIALSSAVAWAIMQNTACIINRYRETAVAAGYNGDSVINCFCDSLACTLGFWLSHFSPWFVILILGLMEEIILGIVIRDNLIINMIQIIFSMKCISKWQDRKARNQIVSTIL